MAAITDEDLALDREIERMAKEQVRVDVSHITAEPTPNVEAAAVVDHKLDSSFLGDHVEAYAPADSSVALEQQIFQCRHMDCDSIEATDAVFKSIFGHVPAECYAMVKGVKMYRIGQVEKGQALDRMTVEQRLFGKPK